MLLVELYNVHHKYERDWCQVANRSYHSDKTVTLTYMQLTHSTRLGAKNKTKN